MRKITPAYLCSLSINEMLNTVSDFAIPLSSVSTSTTKAVLYAIDGYYIEILTHTQGSAKSIKFFEDGEELDKYLDLIDLGKLLP
ncbi:hypothetical protein EXU57_14505 [Segetibacter sp. 3557_3]|uniref:hypothetical protein n=1 Tax=Segetibacter sp. 3557_3 TaxID=2547429 RepID=UPI001058CB21|nr:hypothetical protein [Segetibacter sp. 3557_3]TDH24550.1 hypothetical protein EXU57_14505 [Segetibacter sp. 3557_3]